MKQKVCVILTHALLMMPACKTTTRQDVTSSVKETTDVFYYQTTENYQKMKTANAAILSHFDHSIYDMDQALRDNQFVIYAMDPSNPANRRPIEDVSRFQGLGENYKLYYAKSAFSTHFLNIDIDFTEDAQRLAVTFVDYRYNQQANTLRKIQGTSIVYNLSDIDEETFRRQTRLDAQKLKTFSTQVSLAEQSELERKDHSYDWIPKAMLYGLGFVFISSMLGAIILSDYGKISKVTRSKVVKWTAVGLLLLIVGAALYGVSLLIQKWSEHAKKLQLDDLHRHLNEQIAAQTAKK